MIVPGGFDPSEEVRVIPALLALLRRLADRHDIHVFALAQIGPPACWTLYGATIHNLGQSKPRGRIGSLTNQASAIAAVMRINRMRQFDLIQSVWSGACGLVGVSAARLLKIPCFVHVAGGELAAVPDIKYGGALRWRSRLRERLVLRAASAVSAASAPILRQIELVGIQARRIPLGVDLHQWSPMPPTRREPGSPVRLIHIASLNRVKDQPTMLAALSNVLSAHHDCRVDIVGEDTLDGNIQAQARRLGMADRIHFHGFLTQRQLRPLIERAHINVISSRHEAGPLVVLEAALVGVPTVATAVGHIVEMAPDAAVSVPIGSAMELAAGINQLIDNEDRRLSIAAAALDWAIVHDAEFTVREFEAMYSEFSLS